jgi:hypothetical protein
MHINELIQTIHKSAEKTETDNAEKPASEAGETTEPT